MRKTLVITCCALVAGVAFAQAEQKGNDGPSGIGQVANATGGPDGFGYTWADQADGCVASVTDISGTGTPVVTGDDTSSGSIALGGGAIDFYGTSYSSLNMAANGYISTDGTDTGPDLSNDCPLPAAPSTGGGARMYPLHDDLNLVGTNGYFQWFAACPVVGDHPALGCNVFMWNDVQHFGGAAPWDMAAYVYDSYDITFAIGPGNPETGSGSTTGIQNDGATIGLTYACNTAASVPDNTAVCFFHPNSVPVELQSLSID